jgi:phytoene synthase
MDLFTKNAFECSEVTTLRYSTSFSLGIRLLKKKYRMPIFGIYGFVRFADEIVDTFDHDNIEFLLDKFISDTWEAIDSKISTNPILHSFQYVVNYYQIPREYIESFLNSMRMDLHYKQYDDINIQTYIYGSAEAVGLMCLKIFCYETHVNFEDLIFPARKLGEAFQKVNFLRDIRADYIEKGRQYFCNIDFQNFTAEQKNTIIQLIYNDFHEAYKGILLLPKDVKIGVMLAYKYYYALLGILDKSTVDNMMLKRHRVSNFQKLQLFLITFITYKLKLK